MKKKVLKTKVETERRDLSLVMNLGNGGGVGAPADTQSSQHRNGEGGVVNRDDRLDLRLMCL